MRAIVALLLCLLASGLPGVALGAIVAPAADDPCCAATCSPTCAETDRDTSDAPCPDDCRLRPCCAPVPVLPPVATTCSVGTDHLSPLHGEAPANPATAPPADVFHPPRPA